MRIPWIDATIDPALRALGGLTELRGMRRAELHRLRRHFDEVEVPQGEVLAHAGRPCAELLVIVEGHLGLVGPRGRDELGPGDTWGWRAMAERGPNPATLFAASRARLLVMGRAQFRALGGLPPRVQPPPVDMPAVTRRAAR